MCKVVGLLLILLCTYVCAWGQKEIDLVWKNDTAWYVNQNFSTHTPEFSVKFVFPAFSGSPWTKAECDFGDATPRQELTNFSTAEKTLTHVYKNAGAYWLKIYLSGASDGRRDTVFCKRIMNRGLAVDFVVEPAKRGRCIEWGGDSILVYLKQFDNPPQTKYNIEVESSVPLKGDTLFNIREVNHAWPDSAYVVFLEPTGLYGAKISISMECKVEGIGKMEGNSDQSFSVWVYQSPDLKHIFNFADSLQPTETFAHFDICYPEGKAETQMSLDILKKYQYRNESGIGNPNPYYNTCWDREGMKIDYYYSDSIATDGSMTWAHLNDSLREVLSEYVDTASDITFKKSGFYKLRLEALNGCGVQDTLWTDSLKGSNLKRLFRVHEADPGRLFCLQDTVCLNWTDHSVRIVDRNVRRAYDGLPEYAISVSGDTPDFGFSQSQKIYRKGVVQTGVNDGNFAGCDSVVIDILFDQEGHYNITINSKTACNIVTKEFAVVVGGLPTRLAGSSLEQTLIDAFGFVKNTEITPPVLEHCDTFRYGLPMNREIVDGNVLALDSVLFHFRKGSLDSVILNRTPDSFLFDSTGLMQNYIVVKAHNRCGWAKRIDSVNFIVHQQPDIKLLRDGVLGNDSLCVGFTYPYLLKGNLPDHFKVDFSLERQLPFTINGTPVMGKATLTDASVFTISYPNRGTYLENITITNAAAKQCKQSLAEDLEILKAPDAMSFKDSIRYCDNWNEIPASALFEVDVPFFKWANWKWQNKAVVQTQDGALPPDPFVFSASGIDSLLSYRYHSTGCFRKDTLVFRAQEKAILNAPEKMAFCLPDTVKNYPGLLPGASYGADLSNGWCLRVYQEEKKESALLYEYLKGSLNKNQKLPLAGLAQDSVLLIYELYNERVDTAFLGACIETDTLRLNLYRPYLQILGADTLLYNWENYYFNQLKIKKLVDTAALLPNSFVWEKPLNTSGSFLQNGLYSAHYKLSSGDQKKDTLLFPLKALNVCNDELNDTLTVILSHAKLKAYRDTICSNTEDYPLWQHMATFFVDTTSLKWNICYPLTDKGVITGTRTGAIYSAKDIVGDSVRIAAQIEEMSSGTLIYDTIILKVNPAPSLQFHRDTLWACNRKVVLDDIKSDYITYTNCTLQAGNHIAGDNGSWGTGEYVFPENVMNFSENLWRKVSVKGAALKGCADVYKEVTLIDPVPAMVIFKRTREEMCAGKVLKLDTIYTLTGKDQHIHFQWKLSEYTGSGGFDADTTHYIASAPEDRIQKMSVATYKSYTCYDGNAFKGLQLPEVVLPITVHREPDFHVVPQYQYDTLCSNLSAIIIQRDWVYVKPALYPDYTDSLRVNGQPLTNGGLYHPMNNEGQKDKLVVTVAQGRCTEWAKTSDTIHLYRLPSMIAGKFEVGDVCEEGAKTIQITEAPLLHAMATGDYKWTATGGTITQTMPPVYQPSGYGTGSGSVTLHVPSIKAGCDENTLEKQVVIYALPHLNLTNDTVCKLPGSSVVVPVLLKKPETAAAINFIDWYRKGEVVPFEQTMGTNSLSYSFRNQDILNGGVELVAQVVANLACPIIYDTVKIVLWDKPEIDIPALNPIVCQGGEINLNDQITVHHAGMVDWKKTPGTQGILNGSVYQPGEWWTQSTFTVKAEGKYGCPAVTKNLTIDVNYAPLPEIKMDVVACQLDTVHFEVKAVEIGAIYDWEFGHNLKTAVGSKVKYVYPDVAGYTVELQATYTNTCQRVQQKEVIVNQKPKAWFETDPQLPIGKPVTFTSLSQPSNVTCLWNFAGTAASGSPCSYTFNGNPGNRKVQLKVTTAIGCSDTVSHNIVVVNKPRPDFSMVVDSCSGIVNFVNTSSDKGFATALWKFGNNAVDPNWEPVQPAQHYERVFKDTIYTATLILSNIAGVDSVKKSVKMISKLQAGLEVLPDECNNSIEKRVLILNQGAADTTWILWGDNTQEKWDREQHFSSRAHRYPQNNTNTVKYYAAKSRIKNKCEESVSAPLPVMVYPVSVEAVITADTAAQYKNPCFGHERKFWNKSYGFKADGYQAEWQFEKDGEWISANDLTQNSQVWGYDKPGNYQVILKVSDRCNTDTDTLPIVVQGNDSLDFVFAAGPYCSGKDVEMNFVQKGTAPFGNFRWTFPDATQQNGTKANYHFNNAGNYWVKLSAKAEGCETEISHSVNIFKSPTALATIKDLGPANGCQPFRVQFAGTNTSDAEAQVLWNFKNNAFSTEWQPVNVFDSVGNYSVSFCLTTPAGCIDSVNIPITVLPTPNVRMELAQLLFCTRDGNFEVIARNLTPQPEKSTFEWLLNDNPVSIQTAGIQQPLTNTFGKIAVKLKAVHQASLCRAEIVDTVVSAHQVVARLHYEPSLICQGNPVYFSDSSLFASRVEIDPGDNWIRQGDFEYLYEEAGEHAVRMTAYGPDGCVDVLDSVLKVNPTPRVDFNWLEDNLVTGLPDTITVPSKPGGGIRFYNLSAIDGGSQELLKYKWDFGDLTFSQDRTPVHLYANNGNYTVTLYATSQNHCTDSISDVISIDAVKGLYFPSAFAPAVADEGVNRFQPKGVGLYSYKVSVFDTWGACVWTSQSLENGRPVEYWDGTFNGQPLPGGTYKWVATATFINGSVWDEKGGKGVVVLIR